MVWGQSYGPHKVLPLSWLLRCCPHLQTTGENRSCHTRDLHVNHSYAHLYPVGTWPVSIASESPRSLKTKQNKKNTNSWVPFLKIHSTSGTGPHGLYVYKGCTASLRHAGQSLLPCIQAEETALPCCRVQGPVAGKTVTPIPSLSAFSQGIKT